MTPQVDFVGEDTPDELPLPPIGTPVDVKLEDAQDKMSKSSDKPMIELTLNVVAPGEDYDGFSLWMYLVEPATNRKTQIRAKRIAKAFGKTDDDLATGVDFTDLIGATAQVMLKKDKDQDGGEARRIKDFVLPV